MINLVICFCSFKRSQVLNDAIVMYIWETCDQHEYVPYSDCAEWRDGEIIIRGSWDGGYLGQPGCSDGMSK